MDDTIASNAFDFIAPLENNGGGSDYDRDRDLFYPYWDVSRYSIGYGTLAGTNDHSGINSEEAKRRSVEHIKASISTLSRLWDFERLNENQKIAVLSYAYQYGEGGFLKSQFRKKIDNGELITTDWASTLDYRSRRIKEVEMFNKKIDPFFPIIALTFLGVLIAFIFID